jgi:hypothetical protein
VGNRVGKIGSVKPSGLTRLPNDRKAARAYSERVPCALYRQAMPLDPVRVRGN